MSDADATDRAELRRIVDGYARGVDRREPEAVAALFAVDGRLEIYEGDPEQVELARVRAGREEIAAALAGLERYEVTTHFLGQHLVELSGDRATGETYCMAHHISATGEGDRHDRVLSIRYLDDFERGADGWVIRCRRLAIDWSDERTVRNT